ncbi:MAG: Zn-dependent oligopeptidase [Acidimicrobiales bacterium]|jgi:Zn-dependent oligopeptidase
MSKKAKKETKVTNVKTLLHTLNTTYLRIHTNYEKLFWISYMGDHSVDDRFEKAQIARETFRSNEKLLHKVTEALHGATKKETKLLEQWEHFFSKFQTPVEAKGVFKQIISLEKTILKKQTTRKEGYIHHETKKFVKAPRAQMQNIMTTHADEKMRKACFVALEDLAIICAEEFVELVALRNQYAQILGYEDFYAYKIKTEEGMTKHELFTIFDEIYEETKFAFKEYHKLEKTLPRLRKPWNLGYMLAGDFTKETDQYFPFEEALDRWGRSFAALGISYQGGKLQLDLLNRDGKYENGFCHWPYLVHYKDDKKIPGSANFTCNVVYGQVGSSEAGYNTLFHEGGHAAHLMNSTQSQVCVNNEYPPASTAWDETQSMFLDTVLSSIEWKTRYAKNEDGVVYPFDLYQRRLEKLHRFAPLSMMGISSVMKFEKRVYEEKKLTKKKLLAIAKATYVEHTDTSVASYRLLSIPHIYSWESSCAYQGYGLAQLALTQWREYFYKKYDYIVDNPKVGKEMTKMWTYASSETFSDCVKMATGKKLSAKPYIKSVTSSIEIVTRNAKKRIKKLETVKSFGKDINLNAEIKMVHGKKTITTNKKGFEVMAAHYKAWLETQRIT